MEDRWSNDSVYLPPLRMGERETAREGGRRDVETRRSEARKTILLVHISYWCIIGGKERGRAKRRERGWRERLEHLLASNEAKRDRANEKWWTYLSA